MFVCLFHFFLETTDPIGLKFYMGFRNRKVQRTKQGGVCRMHNHADISMMMRTNLIVLCSSLTFAPHPWMGLQAHGHVKS